MRGEWIEIPFTVATLAATVSSLPMRGEWIEIRRTRRPPFPPGLSPCGESGLKSCLAICRAFWQARSLPMRGEWIEITSRSSVPGLKKSLPMRGEWIEIKDLSARSRKANVSPHAGRVD